MANGKRPSANGYIWRWTKIEDLPGEIWKQVPEDVWYSKVNGPFVASNFGRLKNNRGQLIKGSISEGYLVVSREPQLRVNRIIALTFIPKDDPLNKPIVLHDNDVKTDNRVVNLYWGSYSKNTEDAHRTGRINLQTPFGRDVSR